MADESEDEDLAFSGDILNWKPKPKDPFRDKKGRLTRYAFSCGYVEQHTKEDGTRVQLFLDGCWHVRIYQPDYLRPHHDKWETFTTLGRARKYYDRAIRESMSGLNAKKAIDEIQHSRPHIDDM